MPVRKRRRLSADLSRTRILEAAEKRLIAGGPDAVRVQPIARDLGLTDAAIHHHFGSREALLEALLHFGGRRLRDALARAIAASPADDLDVRALVDGLLPVLEDGGYAWLALWLVASGWREEGSGLFDDVVDAIDRERRARARAAGVPPSRREESRHLAAWLALTLFAEPLLGRAARRSVSLPGDAAAARRFRAWVVAAVERLLDPP